MGWAVGLVEALVESNAHAGLAAGALCVFLRK